MDWLVASIVLSVVLTVLLDVGLRAFPDAGRRVQRHLDRLGESTDPGADTRADPRNRRGVHVVVPWRAMIVVSLVLTVVVNLVLVVAG